jgi:amino acid adenylation domain-containing protein
MTLASVISKLKQKKIKVWLESGQLRYQAPQGAMDEELKQELRQNRDALIALLGKTESIEASTEGIGRLEPGSEPVASFAQQRLWFLDKFLTKKSAYNLLSRARLLGSVDVEIVCRVIEEIVRRHEVLRTTFLTTPGGEVRVVLQPPRPWRLHTEDLRGMKSNLRAMEIQRRIREEALWEFDLSAGPLLRVRLIQLEDNQYELLVNQHHIVSDAWSVAVLSREFALLYEAFAAGKPSPLPELPLQYADYAHWQRQRLQGDMLERQLAYWRDHLNGAPFLDLPTDYPRPSMQSYRGRSQYFDFSVPLSKALNDLSRRHDTTLFVTLLTAFYILLQRYTGQDDLCIGTPIANRTHAELEPLIGFFVNTLVLRADLSGDPTFAEMVARVRTVSQDAYSHQDLPFEHLVAALDIERDQSRPPLFQVVLGLQNTPADTTTLAGMEVRPLPITLETSKFDITLMFFETDARLQVFVEYSTDLFKSQTIERLLAHFERLLTSIVASPTARLSQLSLLTQSDYQAAVSGPNATGATFPVDCLHRLFERHAVKTPDARAVVFGEQGLSYAELNARANRLAHCLREQGVGPDTLVGLCVERSLELVVGVLGILKAGGAYVPLDPSYPQDRLMYMFDDAKVVAVVTHRAIDPALYDLLGQRTVLFCLDRDAERLAAASPANPADVTAPDHLAYVIYTSGSTGRPKGNLIPHANVARLLSATEQWFGFGPRDVWTLFHSYAFDFSVWELWGALAYGGCLVVVPYEVSRSPRDFHALLARESVTVLNQTPSAFSPLIEADRQADRALSLRWVIFGGEALDLASLRPWYKRHRDTAPQLVNMYGITETTVHVTYCPIRFADLNDITGSPIGRPIEDLQLYVLDRHQNVVPAGVPGEMYVGGAGLARGYLNRPDLTAERFVPNRFSSTPGARLYRTGDLAKYLADGGIEYLGRADHQVKIRGFRIELGEIEHALLDQPAVKEAVVLAHARESGDKYLAAYVVPSAGESIAPEALRDALRASLPDYMVPAFFVALDAMPLTSNGKIDRRKLQAPDASALAQRVYVAPRTELEHRIVGVWSEILGLPAERIGVQDNFFALGGHSLLATMIISRLNGLLEVELSVRDIFIADTLEALASIAQERIAARRDTRIDAIARLPRNRPLSRSFSEQRFWFFDKMRHTSSVYNVPIAVRLQGPLQVEALRHAFEQVVARHETLRTTYPANSKDGQVVIHQAPAWKLPVVDLRDRNAAVREREAFKLVNQAAKEPFDLAKGPLLRTTLLRLDELDHILMVTLHHIVTDGWSIGVLSDELTRFYDAFVLNRAADLPELPIQYADYAHWQRERLVGERLERELAFWQRQLEGVPVLNLPTDRPRPPEERHWGAIHSFTLDSALTSRLNAFSREHEVSLFVTLLAGFQALLYRHSGQRDFCVGTPTANRSRAELEPLIGCFINVLAIRADFDGDPTFAETIARVNRRTSDAMAHQEVPFDQLVTSLRIDRELSRAPVYQVMLALQNTPAPPAFLTGLTLSPVPVEINSAKLDLTLSISEYQGALHSEINYATDLFDPQTIERLCAQFQRLLDACIAAPASNVSRIPLLTDDERDRMIDGWNATAAAFPDSCIHTLIEQQVERTPDAPAVVFGDRTLSYRELNARANQLAHDLRERGVGPDSLVGICIERSLDLVIGIVGILKAGGAYVPLDPGYPEERLAYMVEDAKMHCVLVDRAIPRSVHALLAKHAVLRCLADEQEHLRTRSHANPVCHTVPGHLAYVIYTSGSTGRPKGVMNYHGGLVNRLTWMQSAYGLTSQDRVLQKTPFSFDVSVWEFLWPLITGATLVVAKPDGHKDPAYLMECIRGHGITTLHFVPSMLEVLLNHGDLKSAPRLTRVICSGEALPANLAARFFERAGEGAALHNLYGPTEASIDVTYWACQPGGAGVPIGYPIANTQLHVLDAYLNPVPVGVAGELYIAGVGLARGYLNRPDLTAECFIANPFAREPGARMYRTGDLAKYLPNGAIEYLGRLDDQVKIRGFRIELGEIEQTIARHADVKSVVVVARKDAKGSSRLVAYIVPTTESMAQKPAPDVYRSHVAAFLPEYMVPSTFVFLPALPLSPNGKIDRKALPQPEMARPDLRQEYVAARDDIELGIVNSLAGILGISGIGVHDNAFDLGMTSVDAVDLMADIERWSGVALPIATVFRASTPAELADIVRAGHGKEAWSPLVEIQPSGTKPPLFCIHPAGGGVLSFGALAPLLGPDQPLYGMQARGMDGKGEPFDSVEAMAACYVAALRSVQPEGPYHLVGWCTGGVIAYEMAQQLTDSAQSVALLAMLDTPNDRALGRTVEDIDGSDISFIVESFRVAGVVLSEQQLRSMNETEREEHLISTMQRTGLLPAGLEMDVAKRYGRFLGISAKAYFEYEGRLRPYQGLMTLIRAWGNDRGDAGAADSTFGWKEFVHGGVDVHMISGAHEKIFDVPYVHELAACLDACLRRAGNGDKKNPRHAPAKELLDA